MRRLAAYCGRRGISAGWLAERLGRDTKTVLRYWDQRKPRRTTIEQLCRALGLDIGAERALCDDLSDRDYREIQGRFIDAFPHPSVEQLEQSPNEFGADGALPQQIFREALRAFALSEIDVRLDAEEREPEDALAQSLKESGFPFYSRELEIRRRFPEHIEEMIEEIGDRANLTMRQRRNLGECLQESPYVHYVDLPTLIGSAGKHHYIMQTKK